MAKKIINIKHSLTKPLIFSSLKTTDVYNIKINHGVKAHIITVNLPLLSNFNIEADFLSRVSFTSLLMSQRSTKLVSNISLQGKGAQVYQQVLVLGANNSQTDLNLTLNHEVQDTFGRLIVRRIQAQNSISALYGMLNIESSAHGADSYLSDKVVLLGDKSKATSVPSLEIKTNDVLASHSATVAKLSPEELFYLRARGLTEDAARALLLKAFIGSVLVDVPDNLKYSIINKLSQLNTNVEK